MNESVKQLVTAMLQKDAMATESTFQDAMAEKISAKLDDLRVQVAQNMFNAVDSSIEEELTDEEFESILSEGELAKAVKAHANAEVSYDDSDRTDPDRKKALHAARAHMHGLAKKAGIKPSRATKVSHRLVNRYYGEDDGVKVKK